MFGQNKRLFSKQKRRGRGACQEKGERTGVMDATQDGDIGCDFPKHDCAVPARIPTAPSGVAFILFLILGVGSLGARDVFVFAS